MEAGYDYMMFRGPRHRKPNTLTGIFLVILGSMLITTSLAYHAYTGVARADLVNLEATLPGVVTGARVSVQQPNQDLPAPVLARTNSPEMTAAQPEPQSLEREEAAINPVERTTKRKAVTFSSLRRAQKGQHLYRIISSQVVHEQDIRLYDTGGATIHLVSCAPRWSTTTG